MLTLLQKKKKKTISPQFYSYTVKDWRQSGFAVTVSNTVFHCFYAWRRGLNVKEDLAWLIFFDHLRLSKTSHSVIAFILNCSLSKSLGSVLSKLFHFLLHSVLLFMYLYFIFIFFYCEYHEIDFISVNAMDWFSARLTRKVASGLGQTLFY